MGTIQPSRFLSHTGKILPGVRRVVQIAQPAADQPAIAVVPAGVMWYVVGGYTTLATDATVATRYLRLTVSVDGVVIWLYLSPGGQAASLTFTYNFQSSLGTTGIYNSANGTVMQFPGGYLPTGAVATLGGNNFDANDQIGPWNLWIEEVYVTDSQLSEIARTRQELNREIAEYEFEQAEQASGRA